MCGLRDEEITWSFADCIANDNHPRDREVNPVVALTYAGALRDAVELKRRRDSGGARTSVGGNLDRLRRVWLV